jgi:C4-dicarboxylate-specific signal transduction histidine kinase
MKEFLQELLSSDFMPHGYCYSWKPGLVWLHLVSDVLIALAYFSIPLTLVYFIRKRKDLPFNWMFLCFGTFILACGSTHLMEVWTLWHGTYWLSGAIKALTALASVPTAILLLYLVPHAVALPSPQAMRLEIAERKSAERALNLVKEQLEFMVQERTAELSKTNKELIAEIAQRKRSEEALQAAQAQMARMARVSTMGELTSSIAHEINQPLAAVVTNGDASLRWLGNDPPNLAKTRESITGMIKEANRASEVIKRIRALAKKTPPQKAHLKVNEVIDEAIGLVGGQLARQGVVLRKELVPNLPPVIGDRVQVQQVILNLIANGIEAMEEVTGRPRELSIGAKSTDDGRVLISVSDCGTGIEPESADHLFEAFFTTKQEGMGLGLSISRTIVEGHQGRLWATPNTQGGATFQFTLPVASAAGASA